MKQHITVEQLNQLSEEAKERLREWWEPNEGDWFYDYTRRDYTYSDDLTNQYAGQWVEMLYSSRGDDYESIYPKELALPLLSIGQMIEFLVINGRPIKVDRYRDWHIFDASDGDVFLTWDKDIFPELCDALWEAVKHVLNETK